MFYFDLLFLFFIIIFDLYFSLSLVLTIFKN